MTREPMIVQRNLIGRMFVALTAATERETALREENERLKVERNSAREFLGRDLKIATEVRSPLPAPPTEDQP